MIHEAGSAYEAKQKAQEEAAKAEAEALRVAQENEEEARQEAMEDIALFDEDFDDADAEFPQDEIQENL